MLETGTVSRMRDITVPYDPVESPVLRVEDRKYRQRLATLANQLEDWRMSFIEKQRSESEGPLEYVPFVQIGEIQKEKSGEQRVFVRVYFKNWAIIVLERSVMLQEDPIIDQDELSREFQFGASAQANLSNNYQSASSRANS